MQVLLISVLLTAAHANPMLLVNTKTGETLYEGEKAAMGGPNGDLIAKGEAIWIDVPVGELGREMKFDVATQEVVVDAEKKAKRLDATTKDGVRRARLKNVDWSKSLTAAELKAILKDVVDALN